MRLVACQLMRTEHIELILCMIEQGISPYPDLVYAWGYSWEGAVCIMLEIVRELEIEKRSTYLDQLVVS